MSKMKSTNVMMFLGHKSYSSLKGLKSLDLYVGMKCMGVLDLSNVVEVRVLVARL